MNTNQIIPEMPVVCSQGGQFATVDHMEGSDSIKLNKDEQDQHHYIPTSWVTDIKNGKVVIDRPSDETIQDQTKTPRH
jgi:hypothetical protein